MFKRLLGIATATTALGLAVAVPAVAQGHASTARGAAARPAITNPVCDGSDYVTVYSDQGSTCYANAGSTHPNIHNVWQVCSGNNDIYVSFASGGPAGQSIARHTCYSLKDWAGDSYLTDLTIY
ncbi:MULTISPECIES: beta/gamma crystallin domain-containing protein [unclassified Streptomyces]|uniref:beta/gamma crystallin domain-containing protein n=1 Tax=unclassified Streptomyces TaxID=2593676 RepID=UPI0037FFD34B